MVTDISFQWDVRESSAWWTGSQSWRRGLFTVLLYLPADLKIKSCWLCHWNHRFNSPSSSSPNSSSQLGAVPLATGSVGPGKEKASAKNSADDDLQARYVSLLQPLEFRPVLFYKNFKTAAKSFKLVILIILEYHILKQDIDTVKLSDWTTWEEIKLNQAVGWVISCSLHRPDIVMYSISWDDSGKNVTSSCL